MPSFRDGNAIETLLMTAQINMDFVNHPVPSTTEPLTSLVRVGTDACELIINSILRYKEYDFHKNAWPRVFHIVCMRNQKVRLSKQQDEDHERYAAQRYPTHVQSVTYPANTQAKEEAVPAANQDRI
ncbi:uncharacterized protein TNCV_3525051 [Trichonephila clavipes]|uniref:Uncharacterized protein n=1 Tax=Trichonephila clavipes TaxID=2585209 RepID=A0A8X6VBN2_TRICX|nr:uncharacterized protein TNCV_3525051 [Trichonephila clavipes]